MPSDIVKDKIISKANLYSANAKMTI